MTSEVQTLRLTSDHFDADGRYIGEADVTDFDGHIEIAANLGWCRFEGDFSARLSIVALAGTGIEAGWGIKAGWGIEAGCGIKAGTGIKAGWGIEAGEGIKAGWGIEAGCGIKAGTGIEAGEGIEAGWGIKAGCGVKAGTGIEAGEGIKAGGTLYAKFRIFAGIASWIKTPTAQQKQITCKRLVGGEICYGDLVETEKAEANV